MKKIILTILLASALSPSIAFGASESTEDETYIAWNQSDKKLFKRRFVTFNQQDGGSETMVFDYAYEDVIKEGEYPNANIIAPSEEELETLRSICFQKNEACENDGFKYQTCKSMANEDHLAFYYNSESKEWSDVIYFDHEPTLDEMQNKASEQKIEQAKLVIDSTIQRAADQLGAGQIEGFTEEEDIRQICSEIKQAVQDEIDRCHLLENPENDEQPPTNNASGLSFVWKALGGVAAIGGLVWLGSILYKKYQEWKSKKKSNNNNSKATITKKVAI